MRIARMAVSAISKKKFIIERKNCKISPDIRKSTPHYKTSQLSQYNETWLGCLAQWLERCIHIAEVAGSNPAAPTNLTCMHWKKIAANTVYQLIGKGVGVVSTIITVALVTRALGVSQFGEYVLITTVPAFLYLVADFGLNAVFLRQIATDNHHVQKFGSLLVLRLGLSLLTFLLALSYAFLSPFDPLVKGGVALAAP